MTNDLPDQRQLKTEQRAASDRERLVQARFASGRAEQLRAVRNALDTSALSLGWVR